MVRRKENTLLGRRFREADYLNPEKMSLYMSVEEVKMFKFSKYNRGINRNSVAELKAEMKKHGTALFENIRVNRRTGNIIDGQHRVVAFLSLVEERELPEHNRLNVDLVDISVEEEIEEIITLNNIRGNWTQNSFIQSYVDRENKHYVKLREICERHKGWLCDLKKTSEGKKEYSYKYRYAAAMATGAFSHKALKDGSFTMTDEESEKSKKVFDEFIQLVEILGIDRKKGAWIETFFVEWHTWRELLPFDQVKEAAKYIANSTSDKHTKCVKRVQQGGSRMDWRDLFNSVKDRIKKQAK